MVSGFRLVKLQERELLSFRETQRFPGPENRGLGPLQLPVSGSAMCRGYASTQDTRANKIKSLPSGSL